MSEQKDKKMDSEVQDHERRFREALNRVLERFKDDPFFQPSKTPDRELAADDLINVTRVETIDWTDSVKTVDGVPHIRAFVKYNCKVELQLQDDGRTLKIFVRDRE